MTQQSAATTEGKPLKKLILPAVGNLLLGVIALGVVLFLPAWTLNYWQAWVFDILFMGLITVTGVYFSIKDPALMERRKQVGPAAEQSTGQKIMISFAYLCLARCDGFFRVRSSLRVVADACLRKHHWSRVGGSCQPHLVLCAKRKYLCGGYGPDLCRPKSHLDRALCAREASQVRG